ncbi:MAG: Yip1 family protein [Paracoccaceae bacterium]
MTDIRLKSLIALSIRDPRLAGETILSMRLPDPILWQALTFVSVISTLIVAGMMRLSPIPDNEFGLILIKSPIYSSPLLAAVMQWGQSVISIFVVHWIGRIFGGTGSRANVLALVAWLHFVALILVIFLVLLGSLIPMLSAFGLLMFIGWWLWSFVTFVDVAHALQSMFKAAGVLVVSFVGFLFGVSFVVSLLGGLIYGIAGVR